MKGKISALILAGILSVSSVCAQTFDVLPYEFGFEESESSELAKWVLNPGTDLSVDSVDRWTVGRDLHRSGTRAMYISQDSVTMGAGSTHSTGVLQFAYRDFVLPTGQYYITFDWICPSLVLYAGYISYVNLNSSPARNLLEQLGITSWPFSLATPSVGPCTNEMWQNSNFTITVKQPTNGQVRTTRIWFAWLNDTPGEVVDGITAAIDNIQLTDAACEIPSGLDGEVIDCDNVHFWWEGSSARYQFQYRKTGDTTNIWRNRMVNNAQKEYTLQGMAEGNYDIRLRGICFGWDSLTNQPDTTYSPYVYLTNFTIYCPELHCINYSNIYDTVWVKCTYGSEGENYSESVDAPYQNTGIIDMGWDNKYSRHTVVWDVTATDPNTEGQLLMVPPGATNSVRLGNWDTGGETEAITYKYVVDPSNSILLVNYAIVLEKPDHGAEYDPRFLIKIKKEDGTLVDDVCGIINLNSYDQVGTGWHSVGMYGDVLYKEWTTLGLNLDPYQGQTIYISLETFDCFWSGHYGYAYFTMDCQTARIKNTSCGNQASMTVHAPTGFKYAWYADNEPRPRSTEQSIEILATDPTNWRCQLTSTENDNCYFNLEINTTARYPQAEFTYEYVPENCENRYYFTNTSHIWTNEDGERHEHRDEVCDEYEWHFGKADEEDDTNEPNPSYVTFPEDGGVYYVSLSASIGTGTGLCRSDTVIRLEVPALHDTHIDTTVFICEGTNYEFHDQICYETGDYIFRGPTPTGCYANDSLHLIVVPVTEVVLPDTTVCYGDTVWIGDDFRARDGMLKHTFTNYLGCDSIIRRQVHVMPHMIPSLTVQEIDEEHETGSISIEIDPRDSILYYTINGERYEGNTMLSDLTGGTFTITFYNRIECTEEKMIRMCVYEVFQRWNDVVSLKNKGERGGGEFIAYQWYNHDEPIEGATRSYYYKHGGFDGTELLYCLVTLPDSTQEQSCTFIPTHYDIEEDVSVSPTSVPASAPLYVTVPGEASVTIYTTMGLPVMSADLPKGTTQMKAPQTRGVYLVTVTTGSGIVTERIVVE